MYKRYTKHLGKDKEDTSSESDGDFEQANTKQKKSVADLNDDYEASSESSEIPSSGEHSDSSDGHRIAESEQEELLTMAELEAGDAAQADAVRRRKKKGQIMLYQCSLCPEKRLASLLEVKEHLESAFHKKREAALRNPNAESNSDDEDEQPIQKKKPSSKNQSTAALKPNKKRHRSEESDSESSSSSLTSKPSNKQDSSRNIQEPSSVSSSNPPPSKKIKNSQGDAVAPQKPSKKFYENEAPEEREARYAAKRAKKMAKKALMKQKRQEELAKRTAASSPPATKTRNPKEGHSESKKKQKP